MQVKRIVANIEASEPAQARAFYQTLFELELLMDLGFIQTYGSDTQMPVQLSVASEGGSGTPVPDLSIEVDDLDEVLARAMRANVTSEYGPVIETWGVRRVFMRDPFGKLLNVFEHV